MGRRTAVAMAEPHGDVEAFTRFVERHEPRLRHALGASFGASLGSDACAAALSWAWETWPRAAGLANPVAYLYKVGRSSLRLDRIREAPHPDVPDASVDPEPFDPDLVGALAELTEQQRAAVVLVHGFGWTLAEAADVLDVKVSTVRNHVRRGIAKLHAALEEEADV
jgi:RNA polymerase sigma factor (sigma-70 family)